MCLKALFIPKPKGKRNKCDAEMLPTFKLERVFTFTNQWETRREHLLLNYVNKSICKYESSKQNRLLELERKKKLFDLNLINKFLELSLPLGPLTPTAPTFSQIAPCPSEENAPYSIIIPCSHPLNFEPIGNISREVVFIFQRSS